MANDPEPLPPTPDPEPDPDDTELSTDEIVTDARGNKTVSMTTMLKYKAEARALSKRVKELEPVAGRVTEVEGRLNEASPVINAILTNPRLKAEALRIASGTHATPEAREQPQDDPDAQAFAEDSGYYLADGQTVDAARARRVLDRLDARHGRQINTAMRPLAGSVLGSRAEQNVARAKAQVDEDGVPVASTESIDEVVTLMGADGHNLLANPQVITMILTQAAGIDHMKKRTPKAQDEPMFIEQAGGGRQPRAAAIDADMRGFLQRQGISEKDYQRSEKNLVDGVVNRKGIPLGGKS